MSQKPIDAKLTRRQTDRCRAAIQTTKIVQRLQDHFTGKLELTATQINSAKILLGKAMPDLSATEITDITPDYGQPQDIEARYQDAIRQAARELLHSADKTTIDKLLTTDS